MADFVPVVAQRCKPNERPAVLVLDSISFRWTDHSATPKSNLMPYSILAAYGYGKDGKNGQFWKLEATPSGDAESWAVNLVHHREYRLSARGTSRMNSDKLDRADPARELFHCALKSRERWDASAAPWRAASTCFATGPGSTTSANSCGFRTRG